MYLTAGTTPGFPVGGNTYTNQVTPQNSSLANWEFTVDIRGFGKLYPGTDFSFDGVDTITVLLPGFQTGNGEKWIIEFVPRAADVPVPSTTETEYSNGYKVADVMGAIMNRRRWRQPTRSDFPLTLASPNIWATDDKFSPVFESEHKIVSPYNVWICQEDDSLTDNTKFNDYLQKLQSDVVLKCLNAVFHNNEFLEKKLLFERFGRQDYLNPNEGKFVGVRITPAKSFDKSVQIDSVALRFNGNVTFNLYLFHDSQPLIPVDTFAVTANANAQTIVNIGKVLSYSDGNKSGAYYFGYFQSDLGSVQAVNEIVQKFNTSYNFGMNPIELPALAGHKVDVNQISFTIKTHGFNLQMSAFRDYTQLIVDNAYLFDNLIGLQMAADVIEMIQNSTRTNKDQRITAELTKMLYTDLNLAETTEESPFSVGLKARIKAEACRVKYEFFPNKRPVSISHDTDVRNIYGTPAEVGGVYAY